MKTDSGALDEQLARANVALTEGRIDDLLVHVNRASDLATVDDVRQQMRVASMLQAAFRFSGDPGMYERALTACVAVGNRTAAPEWAIPARALAGNILMMAGRLHQAVDMCDASLALADACGLRDDRVAAMGHQFRGYVLMEWNRLAEARDALVFAWNVSLETDRGVRSGVARAMAELELASGDIPSAQRWSDTLAAIVAEPITLRNREWLAAVRTRHGFTVSRDLRELDAWQRRHDYRIDVLDQLSDRAITARLHEFHHWLTMLESTSQWSTLGRLGGIMERGARPLRTGYLIHALCARAVALQATGAYEDALHLWSEALACGAFGGFVRVYTDGSPLRMRLLKRAAGHAPCAPQARRVLASAHAHTDADQAQLTDRQREVLRLVAQGLSDREISDSTGLSVATVKTHLRAVFARLGVRSRTAAVAKATAGGWIV